MAITFSVMADSPDELMGFMSSLAAQGFLGKMAAPVRHTEKHVDVTVPPAAIEPEEEYEEAAYEAPDHVHATTAEDKCGIRAEPEEPAVEQQKRRRRTKAEMQAARDAERLGAMRAAEAERHPLAEVCDDAEEQADEDLTRSAPAAEPVKNAHTHGTHTPNGSVHQPAWTKESITALVRKAQKSIPASEVISHIKACGHGSISAMPVEKYQELASRLNERLAHIEGMNRKF